jgi:hypothetical protein
VSRYALDRCYRCDRDVQAPQRMDARGIFITYACDECWPEIAKQYRPEVLTDSQYEADEPIEPEDY